MGNLFLRGGDAPIDGQVKSDEDMLYYFLTGVAVWCILERNLMWLVETVVIKRVVFGKFNFRELGMSG